MAIDPATPGPPPTWIVPEFVTDAVMLAAPDTVVPDCTVTLEAVIEPPSAVVPPLKTTLPEPVIVEPLVSVNPPVNSRVVPLDRLMPPALLPSPNRSVPLCTSMLAVLLNVTPVPMVVVPVLDDLRNVPALLKVPLPED